MTAVLPTELRAAVLDDLSDVLLDVEREAERDRKLPTRAYRALRDAGLFRLLLPVELGGWGVDPVEEMSVYETLSRLNVAACWNVTAGALNSSWAAAYLSDDAVAEIFADDEFVVAGQAPPKGSARRVPGGYRVDGRYGFGSGMSHARWVLGGFAADDADDPRVFVTPKERVQVLDNWHAVGVVGSNSVDYVVEDLLVPDGWWFSMTDLAPRRGGARFAAPIGAQVAASHTGLVVGGARRALDEVTTQATDRGVASDPVLLREIGRAETSLDAARDHAVALLTRLAALLVEHRTVERDLLLRLAAAGTYAVETALEVAQTAYRHGGSAALRDENPLQRVVRDLLVAQQHKYNDAANYDRLGGSLLPAAA